MLSPILHYARGSRQLIQLTGAGDPGTVPK